MSSLVTMLDIEDREKELADGVPPIQVLHPNSAGVGTGADNWYRDFKRYLGLASADFHRASPETLVDAFRAAVRLSRVDDEEIPHLYLQAQLEANLARSENGEAQLRIEEMKQEIDSRREATVRAESRGLELEAEIRSLRAKYARSVQTINRLQAKLSAPSSDPAT